MDKLDQVVVDFSALRELAGGDDMFVMALLMKMCKTLPVSFQQMEQFAANSDWSALASAAHKAKSTFAYLSLDDMRNRLKDIENDASNKQNLDGMVIRVQEIVRIGTHIVSILNAELVRIR